MNIRESTRAYEAWLGARIPLIEADLRAKHQLMKASPLAFLRATFYRWAELWPQTCPTLAGAPALLAVGDLHLENFGTWRDAEGRLVWGVNDLDEAFPLPYPNDLVRLTVSAQLAIRERRLRCEPADACREILAGYTEGLEKGGRPFVLAERHRWLRDLATDDLRDPAGYWEKLGRWPTVKGPIPAEVTSQLRQGLPEPGLPFRVVHRQAGAGSRGRRRFTALAEWRGGILAREAKELTASAWVRVKKQTAPTGSYYMPLLQRAVRAPDPFVRFRKPWLIRRLAPDCRRIELGSIAQTSDEIRLLRAMGWETANLHLATRAAVAKVLADLHKRPARWLIEAANAMRKAVLDEWKEWCAT